MEGEARANWEQFRPGRALGLTTACVAPQVTLELDPTGWVYGCCANQLYPLGRIGESRLHDIWNGPRRQVLVDALARWDLSVGCGSCQWHIEHGRMDPDAAVYDRYPVDPAGTGPVAMTFALSNRCNLGCTMCTPELSSTLRQQAGLPSLSSPYDDQFFDDLAPMLPNLRYAKFLGGEPFLIPEHHRVWDLMAAAGAPSRLQVTTNGTIWNRRVEWLFQHFTVDVTVSMDGATAGTYESIRRGASFGSVVANVHRFADACRRSGSELRFCYCLMEENAHELAAFLHWADELQAPVSVNVVSDVGHALHDLPVEGLEHVRDLWQVQGATPFGLNAAVWDTQVRQLEEVLAERRAGGLPAARQAIPLLSYEIPVPESEPGEAQWSRRDAAPSVVVEARAQLTAWGGASPVAELRGSGDGRIQEVVSDHPRLGVTSALVGRSLSELVRTIEAADGRRAWELGVDRGTRGIVVRTFVLCAHQPSRGSAGSVVRVVGLPADDGWVVMLAEDDLYDRDRSTPVHVGMGRAAPVEARSARLSEPL